jgi:hypothetical protein
MESGDCCIAHPTETSNSAPFWCKLDRSGNDLTKETRHMAMQTHLAELERRHQALEEQIDDAMAHPSSDRLKIAELKRRKLLVKDEIARLRQYASVH